MALKLEFHITNMKNLFYLNFLESKLEQKCSIKKFVKGFERLPGPGTFLTLDCGGRVFPNKSEAKKKLFLFSNDFAVKFRFSRDLFLQSFLLTHQKPYNNFAQKYLNSFEMLRNLKFCTLLILKKERGGFLVRAAGFVCFLPKRSYAQLFSQIAAAHFAAFLNYQLHTLLLFLLKISIKIKIDRRVFSALCEKACFRALLKKKITVNRALLSSRLPLKQRFGVSREKSRELAFKFKLSSSYFRKKFLNKKRTKKGRVKFVLCLEKEKNESELEETEAGEVETDERETVGIEVDEPEICEPLTNKEELFVAELIWFTHSEKPQEELLECETEADFDEIEEAAEAERLTLSGMVPELMGYAS